MFGNGDIYTKPGNPRTQKEELILEGVEKHQSELRKCFLQHWAASHMLHYLEQGREDTIGILTVIDQIRSARSRHGKQVLQIASANVTSHRSEVTTWAAGLTADIIMLQETHAQGKALHNIEVDFNNAKLATTTVPAAPAEGGTSGGLLMAYQPHFNIRTWCSHQEEGKGFIVNVMRLAGFELAVGCVYVPAIGGRTDLWYPSILSELITKLQALSCPWFLAGDWNCPDEELE